MSRPDDLETAAIRAVRAGLAIVSEHAPAEVEIIIASDRDGNIRLRERVSGVPLEVVAAGSS